VPGCPPNGAQIMELWWNSPGHKANMMNPRYSYTGTAAYCANNLMVVVGQYRSG
jgi:uncharacterized protein YkwD